VFHRDSRFKAVRAVTCLIVVLVCGLAAAEIIRLKNGDAIHGSVVGATTNRVTLQTPYGKLIIPKNDILRIEYEGGGEVKTAEVKPAAENDKPVSKAKPDIPPVVRWFPSRFGAAPFGTPSSHRRTIPPT
jgi:RNase P/RNase MRP subunit p29